MLATNDIEALLETGTGTPHEAALMVRCYELAAMELWDASALVDAAMVAGIDAGFALAGECRESITRKVTIAVKSGRAPELMEPPDGIKLLYRIGVLVYDELEETVSRFAEIGRYEASTKSKAETESAGDTPETKEQRQDRRLKACEDAGLVMPASSIGRLPDGVGRIAELEGVKRQSFTLDVKAALKRREAITKPGRVVRQT